MRFCVTYVTRAVVCVRSGDSGEGPRVVGTHQYGGLPENRGLYDPSLELRSRTTRDTGPSEPLTLYQTVPDGPGTGWSDTCGEIRVLAVLPHPTPPPKVHTVLPEPPTTVSV